jgi:hypothetical protein
MKEEHFKFLMGYKFSVLAPDVIRQTSHTNSRSSHTFCSVSVVTCVITAALILVFGSSTFPGDGG